MRISNLPWSSVLPVLDERVRPNLTRGTLRAGLPRELRGNPIITKLKEEEQLIANYSRSAIESIKVREGLKITGRTVLPD